MSDDDECDYMSADFLEKCLPKDVIPGLKRTQHEKREHEILKRKQARYEEEQAEREIRKKKRKDIWEKEADVREEGLATPLDNSNKGFAMMAKMGYKPGTSLGKDNTGISEPVGVVVKVGKAGLGREAAVKRIAEEKCRILEERAKKCVDDFNPAAFRAQMREKHLARRTESDLFKAQKSCRELDEKKDFSEPAEKWFWPVIEKPARNEDSEEEEEEEEVEEEEDLFTPTEKLGLLVTYLRAEHLYCIFCGINFDNEGDLTENCPGPARDDHDS